MEEEKWIKSSVAELASFVIGGDWGKDPAKFSDEDYVEVNCIRGSEIRDWDINKGNSASLRLIKKASLEKRALREGDILIEISGGGPDQPVGRTVYIDKKSLSHNELPSVCTNFLRLYRPVESINSRFLELFFKSFYLSGEIINYQGGSNNLRNLKFKEFETVNVPLPPLPEQERIVTKLDRLFGHLEQLKTRLDKIPQLLKDFRQAVLKKAFQGDLTRVWREEQVNLPTAEVVLKDIKVKRQELYEKRISNWKIAVEEWQNKGRNGKKPAKPKLEKEVSLIQQEEKENAGIIPDKWNWERIGNLFSVFVGSTPSRSEKKYWENGNINWVSSGEVFFNHIRDTKEKVTKLGLMNASTILHPIGTVMLAMIGEGKTRGQAAILAIEACHNQNTAAIRVPETGLSSEYLFHYLYYRYEQTRSLGSGNSQKALNKGRVREFIYPLCSSEEQKEIIQRVDALFSKADLIESKYETLKTQIEQLPQAILAKAFRGALVAQLPTDGDARELLEEIKKLKAEAEA